MGISIDVAYILWATGELESCSPKIAHSMSIVHVNSKGQNFHANYRFT